MVKMAINGFGRIGRAVFKIALEHDEVEVVAINDLGDLENLAYLLKYDTVYGRYGREVSVKEGKLVVDNTEIAVYSEPDPTKLPWGDLVIDVVVESTGIFTEAADAQKHIEAGAKHVIISAPTKSADVPTVVIGVNDEAGRNQPIISNASCTTNSVAPMIAVLDKVFGVKKAILTTVHAYTATQALVDSPAKKDFRRGRAAAENMSPASTGAAIAATLTYPKLKGKFDGMSLRVPVPTVSISDIVAVLEKPATVEEVNEAFKAASKDPVYKDVLAVTDEQVVSSDFIGDPHSVIIDLESTRVVDGDLVKVLGWYDNEWGYSNRMVEQAVELVK